MEQAVRLRPPCQPISETPRCWRYPHPSNRNTKAQDRWNSACDRRLSSSNIQTAIQITNMDRTPGGRIWRCWRMDTRVDGICGSGQSGTVQNGGVENAGVDLSAPYWQGWTMREKKTCPSKLNVKVKIVTVSKHCVNWNCVVLHIDLYTHAKQRSRNKLK